MHTQIADFLAHAVALETEAAERYTELAELMETHNNPEVAGLFAKMSEFSHRHALSVRKSARGMALPQLKPWEFRWTTPEPPEVGEFMDTHYLMTAWHALDFALANEKRGFEYYNRVAYSSSDAEVQTMARQFAAEESEHVSTLTRWLSRAHRPADDWNSDFDPPQEVG